MTLVLSGNTGSALDGIKNSLMFLETAQATTSGTSINFTGIPSWAKKITVMFNGVSTNGTSLPQIQVGSGSFTTTGYVGSASYGGAGGNQQANLTSGFPLSTTGVYTSAAFLIYGGIQLINITSNTWLINGTTTIASASVSALAGQIVLSGTLDRLRLTTVNGTDTFDAGSINILIEGYV
jgi:hypothetical protein